MAEFEFDDSILDEALGMEQGLQRVGAQQEGDENLWVRFFLHPHPDKQATLEAGRPIYEDREYIEIIPPGDRNNTVNRPVREMDKSRFPAQYRAFRQGAEQRIAGTPLDAWPAITRSQVQELQHFKVVTVEQLANLPDNLSQRFAGISSLKNKARAFLDAAQGTAQIAQFEEQISQRDAQIAALTQAVGDLTEAVKTLKNSKSKAAQEQADEAVEAAAAIDPLEVDAAVDQIDEEELEHEDR